MNQVKDHEFISAYMPVTLQTIILLLIRQKLGRRTSSARCGCSQAHSVFKNKNVLASTHWKRGINSGTPILKKSMNPSLRYTEMMLELDWPIEQKTTAAPKAQTRFLSATYGTSSANAGDKAPTVVFANH